MTANADTSNEAIAQYRLDYLSDDENNPDDCFYITDDEVCECIWQDESGLISEYYDATEKLTDILNKFINYNYGNVNPLAEFDNQLVEFELEQGYHDGFRIVINTKCDGLKDLENWYDYNQPNVGGYRYPDELPSGMTFEQFKNSYYKALDFCQYTLIELSKLIPLGGVSGGWTGGEYTHEPNTDDEHKQFKPVFDMLMKDIKNAKLIYI